MSIRELWNGVEETPELCAAIVAAFALVTASDGEAHELELTRFETWLEELPWAEATRKDMGERFADLVSKLLEDDANQVAADSKRCIAGISDSAQHRDLVLAAARSAMVADQRIDEREEHTLKRVCSMLGIDPELG